jgi:2-octaprenyl-6-methoxyphenol hydroxylase
MKDYQQDAIVANVGLSRSHQQVAYERFTDSGLIALLPMTERRAALVWALDSDKAQASIKLSDTAFLKTLQQTFGYRLGRFVKVGKRTRFPLRQVVMNPSIAWPYVFVGNCAHTLHPIAGQGFNLGLRDVALLAQYILEKGLCPAMLEAYQAARCKDQNTIAHFTDGLVELFQKKWPFLGVFRGAGLLLLDNLPPLKQALAYRAQGFMESPPNLVCGIPLHPFGESDAASF